MTKTWFGLSVFFGAVFMLAILGCDRKSYEEKQAEEQELRTKKEAQSLEALSRFGSRFGAEVVKDLELTVVMGAYSILVEKTLIREDGKPIVFWAMVDDVSRSARGYLVHFHHWSGSIHYSLKCQEDHINLILENTSDAILKNPLTAALRKTPDPALIQFYEATFTQFAVVAVIDSVKRIDLMPSADPDVSEWETPSIELTSGKTFWATGRCLALKPKATLLPD